MLNAAIDVFANEGYHGAGMRAISDRAGVTPSTIYHYFGNKRDLFVAAFHHSVDIVWTLLAESTAGQQSVVDEIDQMLHAGAQIMRDRPAMTTIAIRAQIDLTSEELKETAKRPSVMTLVTGMATRAIDRGELRREDGFQFAVAIHTAIWGISMMGRHGDLVRDQCVSAVSRIVDGSLLDPARDTSSPRRSAS